MKIYAAYGSNMNLEQMKLRCPKAKLLGTGKIEGYRLTFRGSGRGVANIEEQERRIVPIVLWEVTNECEESLDIYEGYPRLYIKRDVEVINAKGEKAIAFVYVMAKEYIDMPAQPTRYYLDIIWDGYIENLLDINILRVAMNENLLEIDEKLQEKFNSKSGG